MSLDAIIDEKVCKFSQINIIYLFLA